MTRVSLRAERATCGPCTERRGEVAVGAVKVEGKMKNDNAKRKSSGR